MPDSPRTSTVEFDRATFKIIFFTLSIFGDAEMISTVDRVETIERAIDRFQQRGFVVRFFEIVERATPQRFLGRLDRAVRSQQDDDDRRVVGEQVLQQLDAVHAGHLQIGQREIEPAIFGKLECGFAGGCGRNVVAFFAQDQFENLSLRLLVVNYQNVLSWHVCSL